MQTGDNKVVNRIPSWKLTPFNDAALAQAVQKLLTDLPKPGSDAPLLRVKQLWEGQPKIGAIGGFSWENDLFTLTPKSPVPDQGQDTLVYTHAVGDEDAVPQAREFTIPYAEPKLEPPNREYEYRLWSYQSIPLDGQNAEEFVYISGNIGLGPSAPAKFFMRFKDLKDRLCGTLAERSVLYAKDWLAAFIGTTAPIEQKEIITALMLKSKSSLMPDMGFFKAFSMLEPKNLDSVIQACQQRSKDFDHEGYPSHLPIWDDTGKLMDWSRSALVLVALFEPLKALKSGKDLLWTYFRRLCNLAGAAAVEEKEPWSVKARFWSQGVQNSSEIKFTYRLSPTWGGGLTPAAIDLWKSIIAKQHAKVHGIVTGINIPSNPKPLFCPSPTPEFNTDPAVSLDGYILIGSHPQRFYDLYVRVKDWIKMNDKGFQPGSRTVPGGDAITKWKGEIPNDNPDFETTRTVISPQKLQRMNQFTRATNQNSLMVDKSAKEVGISLASITGLRQAEWLHRSAWSFGGLNMILNDDSGNPDSSQKRNNIIWGTYEANTCMIRYEDYLKRLVKLHECTVILTTTRRYESWIYKSATTDGQGIVEKTLTWPQVDQQSGWIAPKLLYEWEVRTPGGGQTCKGSVKFNLFSRSAFTRFEVMMDEEVDYAFKKLLDTNDPTQKALGVEISGGLWGVQNVEAFDKF